MKDIKQEDREFIRSLFMEAAEKLRKNYDMPVAEIRRYLRQMLEVSV